jgi:hypothetical protein
LFKTYCERLKKKNAWWLIRVCRYLRIAFRPITIKLVDTGEVLRVDLAKRKLGPAVADPEIALHSESFAFILKFPYGFDTLGVNGTFEELKQGGFDKFTKTFAIENLNNIGYSFKLSLAFDLNVILIFIGRLMRASRKLNAGKPVAREVVRARAA